MSFLIDESSHGFPKDGMNENEIKGKPREEKNEKRSMDLTTGSNAWKQRLKFLNLWYNPWKRKKEWKDRSAFPIHKGTKKKQQRMGLGMRPYQWSIDFIDPCSLIQDTSIANRNSDSVIFMIFFFEFPSAVKRICPRVPTSRPFQRSADPGLGRTRWTSFIPCNGWALPTAGAWIHGRYTSWWNANPLENFPVDQPLAPKRKTKWKMKWMMKSQRLSTLLQIHSSLIWHAIPNEFQTKACQRWRRISCIAPSFPLASARLFNGEPLDTLPEIILQIWKVSAGSQLIHSRDVTIDPHFHLGFIVSWGNAWSMMAAEQVSRAAHADVFPIDAGAPTQRSQRCTIDWRR